MLYCAGTASNLCCLVSEYAPDTRNETIIMLRFPVDELFIPLVYINGGGMSLRWFTELYPELGNSYDILEKEAFKIQPGSEGLIFIPHFAGRVLPNNPYIKGSFSGIDWKHTRAHMYRAVLEGIAYEYRNFLIIIKKFYPEYDFKKMVSSGAKSKLFNAIKASVLGVQTTKREVYDAAPLGSAVIAGMACGVFQRLQRSHKKDGQQSGTLRNWGAVYGELAIMYPDRFSLFVRLDMKQGKMLCSN